MATRPWIVAAALGVGIAATALAWPAYAGIAACGDINLRADARCTVATGQCAGGNCAATANAGASCQMPSEPPRVNPAVPTAIVLAAIGAAVARMNRRGP